jgi:hypothetical protein
MRGSGCRPILWPPAPTGGVDGLVRSESLCGGDFSGIQSAVVDAEFVKFNVWIRVCAAERPSDVVKQRAYRTEWHGDGGVVCVDDSWCHE